MRHPNYHEIGRRFRQKEDWGDERPLLFPEEGADLFNVRFHSANAHLLLGRTSYHCSEHDITFPGEPTLQYPSDADIPQNTNFRYPLVREHVHGTKIHRHQHCIILLHGLNEHSFTKYLPWAYHIWSRTGTPVILFPLTFHINRVFPEWGRLQHRSYLLRQAIPGNEYVHQFNAVMSERLESHPQRFFWGAMQSFHDLRDLIEEIQLGTHPHFAEGSRVDLVGFSAGGYLALTLMLDNPGGLLNASKGILFSSCSPVRNINLSSPLIMDLMTEIALMKLYVKNRDRLYSARMTHWFHHHSEARWLDAFCGLRPDRERIEERLREVAPRLLGITNTNDEVMPAAEMLNLLQGVRRDTGVRVVELHLGIHENPFAIPDYKQRDREMVMKFLDVERFGSQFEAFIDSVVHHLT